MSDVASKEITRPGVPARAPRALGHLLRFDRQLQRVEVAVLAASLLLMVALAFAQVLMRTFRTELIQPVAWFDNIARHLVIWVGMLGASLCTAEGRHISIEALPKLFGPGGRRKNEAFVSLASIAVVAVLFVLSMIYMLRVQVPDPAHLFRIEALKLDVARWPFLAIVPVGLAVIGWRFALRAALALWMTDEEFRAREEEAEREVVAADAKNEDEQGAMLLEHEAQVARASGRMPSLTPETAREEVRRVLKSERQPATPTFGRSTPPPPPQPQPPPALAPQPLPPAATPRGTPAVRAMQLPGRSTDEIPIYRDIADDDDLTEPASRRGTAAMTDSTDALDARPAVESSDSLEPLSDVGDLIDDAVERLAETERLKKKAAAPRSDGGPEHDEPPLRGLDRSDRRADDDVTDTDRLPRPDMPLPPPLPDFDADDDAGRSP